MIGERGDTDTSWLGRHTYGVAVGVVMLLALVIRARGFGQGGLVHFDEGAYACGGLVLANMPFGDAIHNGGLNPIIAPPLTFLCVGTVFRLLAIADWVAALVPLAAGVTTVGLTAALVLRICNDRLAAVAAAAFLAVTPYHVIYSRLVLSDGLFLMLFVAALIAFMRAHTGGRMATYVLAGAVTGLCWNTKYHGVFPVVVYVVYLLMLSVGRVGLAGIGRGRWIGVGVAMAVAVGMVLPHVWFIGEDIGLAAFVGHRRSYVSTNLIANAAFAGRCVYQLVPGAILALGALGVVAAGVRRYDGDRWLLALVVTCLVISPWYQPYPRLYLPLALGIVAAAGRCVSVLSAWMGDERRWVAITMTTTAGVMGAWSVQHAHLDGPGYRLAGERLEKSALLNRPALLACQDPMRFYLLTNPEFAGPAAPIWAPGFDFADPRWNGHVAVVVDAVYENDEALRRFLRDRGARRVAAVDNPLPWVVRANYPGNRLADGVIVIYDVPAVTGPDVASDAEAPSDIRLPGKTRGV